MSASRTGGLVGSRTGQVHSIDMLRRCDRYLLREMVGPFLLALAGLVLFILLNIILSLSDLMVDRGIGMLTLLRLVMLKMPSLLVIAIPMSALFATFLGLGRLAHDREIVALESIGIPLRRILMPLVLVSILVGAADFAIYNWGVPASEHAYQQALRSVIFRQGVPRITANAFFKGADNQFFYIRRYDEEEGILHGVHIYDTTGTLFPHAESRVTMITAETGSWTGEAWQLKDGNVYGFDREGLLSYSGTFQSLSIPLDQSIEQVLSRSRTPAEMGIAELVGRIASARETGQRADEYIVEAHLKGSLPLATLVFVLFGGTVSLVFSPRSRSAGIVLGMLLVGLFQGTLWWTQTLGRRGAIDPALAAWIPDLVFGGLGLVLFLRVDRLANRDLWSRLRGKIAWFSILLLAFALPVRSQPAQLTLASDESYVSEDRTVVRASGNVSAAYEDTQLTGNRIELVQANEGTWHLEASGDVRLRLGDGIELLAATLTAQLDEQSDRLLTRRVEATGIVGHSLFSIAAGEEHEIHFEAELGSVMFNDAGDVKELDARRGRITTCDCCEATLRSQLYTLSAERFLLLPDRLLVAFGMTAHIAGVSTFWLPFYVRPLDQTLESPLFPAFGNNALRGWFVKWNLPVFVSEHLYGAILLDYFSRFSELAVGAVARYQLGGHSGHVFAHTFPAAVGDPVRQFDLKHTIDLGSAWQGLARVEFESEGSEEDLSFEFLLEGQLEHADLTISAYREMRTRDTSFTVEERIPEFTVKLHARRIGDFTFRPQLSAGWIREWKDETHRQGLRLGGRMQILVADFSLAGFSIAPEASIELAAYGHADRGWDRQESLTLGLSSVRQGLTLGWGSTFVHGASPFAFDRMESEHELRWKIKQKEAVEICIDGTFDLEKGMLPIDAAIAWNESVSWRLMMEFDPVRGRMIEASLRGSFDDGLLSSSWRIPYDFKHREFDDARFDVRIETTHAFLDLSSDFDINRKTHLSTRVETELVLDHGWGASFSADYIPGSALLADYRYGVFRDIASCVRVGVERDPDQFWFYASIVAFPDAVLRYAPRTSDTVLGR